MEGFPLHPMLVHIPIGIAFIAPILTIVFYSIIKKHSDLKSYLWKILIILQLAFTVFIYASMATGEMNQEQYHTKKMEEKVNAHESLALVVLILSLIAVVTSVAAFKGIYLSRIIFFIIQIVILGFVIYTAHKGGLLVHSDKGKIEHNQ